MNELDIHRHITYRLYRKSCLRTPMGHTKALEQLGRDMKKTLILDNSPFAYILNQRNAIPIRSFMGDQRDTALLDLIPHLQRLNQVDDVRDVFDKSLF
jgi:RNA polymerase II subunit A small phosphatase-like protein